ncbi:MAG: hypothetical protein IJW79_09160 [Clostridia bacterium]|nr:hypothetical protein [Clostridia bacterium]
MNISLKNMLTSFAAGVLLFSLIMLVVCIVFFNSTVEVKEKAVTVEAEKITEIKLSGCIVFEFEETDENNLFCVLVMVDDSNKKLFFTPLYSDYLVPYKGSFSQISTLTEKLGNDVIANTIKTFSGIEIAENDFRNFEAASDKSDLKDKIQSYFLTEQSEVAQYEICEFPLIIKSRTVEDKNEQKKIVDVDANVNMFKLSLGIK